MEKRTQFLFHESYYIAIQSLPKSKRPELYEAVMEYALYGDCKLLHNPNSLAKNAGSAG